jgi:hypothetical protein
MEQTYTVAIEPASFACFRGHLGQGLVMTLLAAGRAHGHEGGHVG